jgi:hypothetical protein
VKKFVMSSHTLSAPVELSEAELDQVAAGRIVEVTENKPGQGNPQGGGQGLIIENQNPAGHAPPGQNP